MTGLPESERRIYGSLGACSPANVFSFSLSKMIFPAILSHLENLTDFRKTLESGLDPRLKRGLNMARKYFIQSRAVDVVVVVVIVFSYIALIVRKTYVVQVETYG